MSIQFLNMQIFSNSVLKYTVFNDAHLREAKFENTNLAKAEFKEARLPKAKFINTNLENAVFHDATLLDVEMKNVNISDADFSNIRINEEALYKSKTNSHVRILPGTWAWQDRLPLSTKGQFQPEYICEDDKRELYAEVENQKSTYGEFFAKACMKVEL